MKQSRRIELCKQYEKHPLKYEYGMKKNTIISKNSPKFLYIFKLPFILIIVYLILAIIGFTFSYIDVPSFIVDLGSDNYWLMFLHSIGLGILNLIWCPISMCISELIEDWCGKKINSKELEKLKMEYQEKGLIEMPESELWKHECCEYDDYREITVCCVTKQPLSYKDYSFCKTPGNCKYCRTFVSGYLGSDAVEWWGKSHEYKR